MIRRLFALLFVLVGFAVIAGAGIAGVRFSAPVAERVYGPLPSWARATSEREPGARILASDIGAIGRHALDCGVRSGS